MKNETLLNCIEVLEKVRNAHYSQLDTSVLAELDSVIEELKKLQNSKQDKIELSVISPKVLQVISHVVGIVCNITNLIK